MLLHRILFSCVAPVGKHKQQICHTLGSLTRDCDSTHAHGVIVDAENNDAMNLQNPQVLFIVFVCVWLLVGLFVAQMSGWAQLARYYQPATPFEGERWRFRSCRMRWLTQYNNCVTAGADTKGLYLAVLFCSGWAIRLCSCRGTKLWSGRARRCSGVGQSLVLIKPPASG